MGALSYLFSLTIEPYPMLLNYPIKIQGVIRMRHYVFSLSFSICSFLFTNVVKAQCSSTSAVSAGTIVDDGAYGDLAYSNPGNAKGSDNVRAVANVLATLLTGKTHYLRATGFNFAIPSSASICGIRVEVEKRAGGLGIGAWIRDDRVRLIKAGTVLGNNLATSDVWTGSEAYETYGNVTELWGTTLTPADVNAANFGVAFAAEFTGLIFLLPSAQVDDIRMTVFFNIALPARIVSFDASVKNNSAELRWQTADEGNNQSIIVQRLSPGASDWTDIARYETQQEGSENKYSYSDPLSEKGNYSYRLAIKTTSQQTIYSKIKNIRFEGHTTVSLYPNPASDFIIIEGAGNRGTISVTNAFGQNIQLQTKFLTGNKVQVNIQQLPAGIYFMAIEQARTRFFKR